MGFKEMMDMFNRWYFQYIIISNVYFLEPVERLIVNTLLVFFLSLVIYTTCVYLPGHSVMMLQNFRNLFGIETDVDVTV